MFTDYESLTEEFMNSEVHAETYAFFLTTQANGADDDVETFSRWQESVLFRTEFYFWMLRLADDGIA